MSGHRAAHAPGLCHRAADRRQTVSPQRHAGNQWDGSLSSRSRSQSLQMCLSGHQGQEGGGSRSLCPAAHFHERRLSQLPLGGTPPAGTEMSRAIASDGAGGDDRGCCLVTVVHPAWV